MVRVIPQTNHRLRRSCSSVSVLRLAVPGKKYWALCGFSPSQHAARKRRKCPLENSSTAPSPDRTRSTTRSARAPILIERFSDRKSIAKDFPVRALRANVRCAAFPEPARVTFALPGKRQIGKSSVLSAERPHGFAMPGKIKGLRFFQRLFAFCVSSPYFSRTFAGFPSKRRVHRTGSLPAARNVTQPTYDAFII